jgi:hypothetical protein
MKRVKNVAHDRQEMHKQFWPGNLKENPFSKTQTHVGGYKLNLIKAECNVVDYIQFSTWTSDRFL